MILKKKKRKADIAVIGILNAVIFMRDMAIAWVCTYCCY